ncbi:hypothetical protein [Streptomyces chrestomyceticus]|uniref:hypothetical protein n=1 Tax=Streptomyces chrestomyceticus TaxID=68185 RepID=UPI003408A07F
MTARFRLKDTVMRYRHPGDLAGYDGTCMRYFAGRPVMWWPEGAQSGLPMERLAAGSELKFPHVDGRQWGPVWVEMRLTRAALAAERHAPYTIVDDAGAPPPPAP